MRHTILALLFVVTALPAVADTSAAASACYSVSDADSRAACLAKVYKDPSRCYSVQSPEKRALCLAEVKTK
ncbi:hypothetical protein ACLIKD_08880 [Azonexus sp. IMCC34842]|uniref:hypothetical protein n=1 Tax=Azonexus sp. IMCC34842 TaxID=3420950 RepID=UPI003D128A1C